MQTPTQSQKNVLITSILGVISTTYSNLSLFYPQMSNLRDEGMKPKAKQSLRDQREVMASSQEQPYTLPALEETAFTPHTGPTASPRAV